MKTTSEYVHLSESAAARSDWEAAAAYAKLAEITITHRIARATDRQVDATVKALKGA